MDVFCEEGNHQLGLFSPPGSRSPSESDSALRFATGSRRAWLRNRLEKSRCLPRLPGNRWWPRRLAKKMGNPQIRNATFLGVGLGIIKCKSSFWDQSWCKSMVDLRDFPFCIVWVGIYKPWYSDPWCVFFYFHNLLNSDYGTFHGVFRPEMPFRDWGQLPWEGGTAHGHGTLATKIYQVHPHDIGKSTIFNRTYIDSSMVDIPWLSINWWHVDSGNPAIKLAFFFWGFQTIQM